MNRAIRDLFSRVISPGIAVVVCLALLSTIGVLLGTRRERAGIPFWVFSPEHFAAYEKPVVDWNAAHPDRAVDPILLHLFALERRMLTGFTSGTPVADIISAERQLAAKAFVGPADGIGFVDLTDRFKSEGLYEQIIEQSFGPWSAGGRIYGMPRDVHPVLLAYRSDIVEAAGIDVGEIETWEDYFRVMRPLQRDFDGDGRPDRWLLNAWETNIDTTSMLLLQADGRLFDDDNRPSLNHPRNAEVLALLVTWLAGPARVCADVDYFTASGHQQQLDGVVVGTMIPDWMGGMWRRVNPALAGKVKLMPLPAWEPGGRRTSVWGGTMLGISRTAADPDACWEFVKHVGLSQELAESMYRESMIIPPIKAMWEAPAFNQPDPFWSGQVAAQVFISQAPHVPRRPSTSYFTMAQRSVQNALIALRKHADEHSVYDASMLRQVMQRLLDEAQRELEREMSRNSFLQEKT